MKRNAGILALVLVVSLLGASDVRGFALIQPAKTTGPALTATIVIDVTEGSLDEGLSSIRVQKASSSAAVLFLALPVTYLKLIPWGSSAGTECRALGITGQPIGGDLAASIQFTFVGMMNGWVPAPELASLVGQFGNPNKAAITDTDSPSCTSIGGIGGRHILSFTAVIQFEP